MRHVTITIKLLYSLTQSLTHTYTQAGKSYLAKHQIMGEQTSMIPHNMHLIEVNNVLLGEGAKVGHFHSVTVEVVLVGCDLGPPVGRKVRQLLGPLQTPASQSLAVTHKLLLRQLLQVLLRQWKWYSVREGKERCKSRKGSVVLGKVRKRMGLAK